MIPYLLTTLTSTIEFEGGNVFLSGETTQPVIVRGATVTVRGFDSSAPVHFINCTVDVDGWKAKTDRNAPAATFEDTVGVVKAASFDGGFKGDDSALVVWRSENFRRPHRYSYLEKNTYTEEQFPDWFWTYRRSDKDGSLKRYGLDLDAFARPGLTFDGCEFFNATQAGLFALYTKGLVVRNSKAWDTDDSRFSIEWCHEPLIENNTFFFREGSDFNNGITFHFYNHKSVARNNEFNGTNLFAHSGGEPQDIRLEGNTGIGRLMVNGGQQFNWTAGAWQTSEVVGNEAQGIEVSGINWGSGLREFYPSTYVANNTVGKFGIRLQAVTGFAENNVVTGARNAVQVDVRFGLESMVGGKGNTLNGLPQEPKTIDFGGVRPEPGFP